MRDLVFVLLIIGFFALSALYIGGCARIIGREPIVDLDPGFEEEEVAA